MNSFTMLTKESSETLSREQLVLSREQLVSMYNDAVEMIWFLESRVRQLSEENDSVWESYEELSRQHFG